MQMKKLLESSTKFNTNFKQMPEISQKNKMENGLVHDF